MGEVIFVRTLHQLRNGEEFWKNIFECRYFLLNLYLKFPRKKLKHIFWHRLLIRIELYDACRVLLCWKLPNLKFNIIKLKSFIFMNIMSVFYHKHCFWYSKLYPILLGFLLRLKSYTSRLKYHPLLGIW